MVKETSVMPAPNRPDGRRERSRRTRGRIVAAAQELFAAEGYLATTIEAVAERAGVAVQTVYYVFGTKQHVLAAVLEATIAGDADPVPVVQRSWVDELRSAPDAVAAVEALIDGAVAIVSRTAGIFQVVQNASTDPEIGALLADTKRRRRADQRLLIEVLAEAGHLHPALDVDAAADVFYAVINEEVFLLLTGDCGWDSERFGRWATACMLQQLTSPDPARSPAR
jgi:AcrR family transcriptional regulator